MNKFFFLKKQNTISLEQEQKKKYEEMKKDKFLLGIC